MATTSSEKGHLLGYLKQELTTAPSLGWKSSPIGFQAPTAQAQAPSTSPPSSALPMLYAPAEGHGMVIAGTGAGKGRSVAIPMLLTCQQPMVVLDIKGELMSVTARRRLEMGHKVFCLDFGHLTGNFTHRFNPLDWYQFSSSDEIEIESQVIASMLCLGNVGVDASFWDASATNLNAAILTALITTQPPQQHNLRQFIKMLFADDLVFSLATLLDTYGKKLPSMAYQDIAAFLQMPDVTRGGVSASAQSHLKVLMSEPVLKATDTSDFSLEAIKNGEPYTLYIIFPPDRLETHGGLLRLWIGALLKAILSRREIPENRTIFLLDEIAQLGHFQYLQTVLTLCRGFGVSCLTFWQDLHQIKTLYPNWQTMVNNCSTLQFFGCKNHLVAKGIAEITGLPTHKITALLPEEQLVVINGKNYLSKRLDYLQDALFAGLYDVNPFYSKHQKSTLAR